MFGIRRERERTKRPTDARQLEDLVVEDLGGRELRLGDQWSRNPALLVFLRHYG